MAPEQRGVCVVLGAGLDGIGGATRDGAGQPKPVEVAPLSAAVKGLQARVEAAQVAQQQRVAAARGVSESAPRPARRVRLALTGGRCPLRRLR
eukprot:COSAG04_NODE_7688_length_1087_cov_1.012146_1_plen_93_part_00